jgi:hypothetical protein
MRMAGERGDDDGGGRCRIDSRVFRRFDYFLAHRHGSVWLAAIIDGSCLGLDQRPEYLRIIYGPEYLMPVNPERLRSRGLGAKRSLASREFALGIESLERFVRKEPLRRTHECAFGVLALESEPVDPRL